MKVENTSVSDFNAAPVKLADANLVNVNKSQSEATKVSDTSTNIRLIEQSEAEQALEQDKVQKVDLKEVAQKLQDFIGGINTSLQFSVDEEAGRDVIKVVDKHSGELVRQFPSEEVLDVIKSLSKATGSLLDEHA